MSAVKNTKCVRKLERPRPLRLNSDPDGSATASTVGPIDAVNADPSGAPSSEPRVSTDEEAAQAMEKLHTSITNGNFDASIAAQIGVVCALLMAKGATMDSSNKEMLNRYFATLRSAAQDERLDACSRLRLLQVIELRGMGWRCNGNVLDFYQRMIHQLEKNHGLEQGTTDSSMSGGTSLPPQTSRGKAAAPKRPCAQPLPAAAPPQSPILLPQHVGDPNKGLAQTSGNKPARGPGRNFPREEAAVQSLDPGRVPVVPGARDHGPVQTRGTPSGDEAALRSRGLGGRSASVVQGGGDGGPSLGGCFTDSLQVDGDSVRISGGDPALVRLCKTVLEKYFAGEMAFSEESPTVAEAQSAAESASPLKIVPPQAAAGAPGPRGAPGRGRQLQRRESCPAFSARSRPPQLVSSVSLEASDPPTGPSTPRPLSYSRDFLLQCSQSELALQVPPDFPPLDAEVENVLVKQARRQSAARHEGN